MSAVTKGMKTRNRTQAAFAQPESSWSRKRSLRIVIRIQIQMTKKKTSNATRSASPTLMSARGKAASFRSWKQFAAKRRAYMFRTLCAGPAQRIRNFPACRSADDDLAVHEGVNFA